MTAESTVGPSAAAEPAVEPGTRAPRLRCQDKPDLRTEIFERFAISGALRHSMFSLFARYYDGVDERRFVSDLESKDRVLVLRDGTGRLIGFTSLEIQTLNTPECGEVRAIFSGDTIVDHRHWGQQALAFAWIRHAGTVAAERPDRPLYWFLIVKGHRTYRYLQAFARRYHPHWRGADTDGLAQLLERFARARFGDDYDHRTGRIAFADSHGHLAPRWAAITPAERRRPEVAYFLERNPGYARGEELACLAALAPGNLRPLARRLFMQGFGR